jgi:putative PIN family toxin of toxin-antitoxin system
MRILYDANVLVTMLSRREAVIEFRELLTEADITHVTSAHILSEVEAVLAERMGLTKRRAKAATRLLARISQIVESANVERVSRDPFDDYIIAAALQGGADYLVTADKDLLVLNGQTSIEIITPAEFQSVLSKT